GRMLVAGPGGNRTYSATGKLEQTLPAGDKQARGFSPNGRLAATIGGKFDQVSVFDTRNGRLLYVLAPKGVRSARFSPDGKLLATADYQGTDLWSPRSGRHVRRLQPRRKLDPHWQRRRHRAALGCALRAGSPAAPRSAEGRGRDGGLRRPRASRGVGRRGRNRPDLERAHPPAAADALAA